MSLNVDPLPADYKELTGYAPNDSPQGWVVTRSFAINRANDSSVV